MSKSYLHPSEIADKHMQIALDQVKLGFWEWDLNTCELKVTLQNKLNFGYLPDNEFNIDSIKNAILPEDLRRPRCCT